MPDLAAQLIDVDQVPVAELPALIAELAALQARAAMRLRQAAAADDDDACDCLTVEDVARRLKCSVDMVRERGAAWGIAKTLAWDSQGRPTRTVYPKALLRAYLNGQPDGAHGIHWSQQRRTAR
jgi:hypothetical protein